MLCKEWSWNSKVTENDSQSQESQLVKNIHLAVSKLFALLLGLGYQNIYSYDGHFSKSLQMTT